MATVKAKTIFIIELEEHEGAYLHTFLQNPPHEDEDPSYAATREGIWRALHDSIKEDDIEPMVDIDWSMYPADTTHLLTTGPSWDGTPNYRNGLYPAVFRGGVYYDTTDGGCEYKYTMGFDCYVIYATK